MWRVIWRTMTKPPPLQQEVDDLLDALAQRWERAGYRNPYVQASSQAYRWMSRRLDPGSDMRTLETVAKKWAKPRGKK